MPPKKRKSTVLSNLPVTKSSPGNPQFTKSRSHRGQFQPKSPPTVRPITGQVIEVTPKKSAPKKAKAKKGQDNEGQDVVTFLEVPVTEQDEDIVTCQICLMKSKFNEFRLHNLAKHYNLATTVEEEKSQTILRDFKFYLRKLRELGQVKKVKTFICPNGECRTKYTTPLGLANHLEVCGKTPEEIKLLEIECDVCHQYFRYSILIMHKRKHETEKQREEGEVDSDSDADSVDYEEPKVFGEIDIRRSKRIPILKVKQEPKSIELPTEEYCEDVHLMSAESINENVEVSTNIEKSKTSSDSSSSSSEEETGESIFSPPTIKTTDFRVRVKETKKKGKKKKRRNDYVKIGEYRADGTKKYSSDIRRKRIDKVNFPNDIQHFAMNGCEYLKRKKREPKLTKYDNPCDSDRILRNTKDPFPQLVINSTRPIEMDQVYSYLPNNFTSVEYKVKASFKRGKNKSTFILGGISGYTSLNMFHNDTIESRIDKKIIMANAGGPVTSMSWHPCGNFIAITTLQNDSQNFILQEKNFSKALIQIYQFVVIDEKSLPLFELKILLGVDDGYINHLQWGNFWPESCDDFKTSILGEEISEEYKNPHDVKINKLGYIGFSSQSSNCAIICVKRSDLFLQQNCLIQETKQNVRFYHKDPEIILKVEESINSGQCVKFDWHEENGYFAAGYGNGYVGLFNLHSRSNLLRNDIKTPKKSTTILHPFWLFKAHVLPVSCIVFDPSSARHLSTASYDRYMKFWDVDLKIEVESNKVGTFSDSCWVRGYPTVVTSYDALGTNPGSQNNVLKYCQIGSDKGNVSGIDAYSVTSLSYMDGMTLAGTENGEVSVLYFECYWRDCDFSSVKSKKNNLIYVSSLKVEDNEEKDDNSDSKPKLQFSFVEDRTYPTNKFPSQSEFLTNAKFYKYLRVNKVSWNPTAQHIAIGYRNGLFSVSNSNFKKLFT